MKKKPYSELYDLIKSLEDKILASDGHVSAKDIKALGAAYELHDYMTDKLVEGLSKAENYNNETELVWGVLSADDLSGASEASLDTMNDFELVYNPETKKYGFSIETIYSFKESAEAVAYVQGVLDKFTAWMVEQGRATNAIPSPAAVFTDTAYDTIEETYAAFKAMVVGYIGSMECSGAGEEDELIYGRYTQEEWNALSDDEQIQIQDRYEYDLQHPEQADWFID